MLAESPFAYGRPVVRGVLRSELEDFQVTEMLGFEPEPHPAGEHLWLWVEKRGQNTPWVAEQLAKAAGLHPSRASFAGLKDRHAITRQWFSLYLGPMKPPELADGQIEGVDILKTVRSDKKLLRGRLKGNRFQLTLRSLTPIDAPTLDLQAELNQRLSKIKAQGVPNFFGEQRFGENNVGRARRLFAGELRGQRSKAKRGFYLSAARSYLFNEVLAERIRRGDWAHFLPGDVAQLAGSHSFFKLEPGQERDVEILDRLQRFDIHPTGPLPGVGEPVIFDQVAALEAQCLARHPDLVEGLMAFKVKAMRRSLRSEVMDLDWHWLDGETVMLSFSLAQGAFATTVVRELIAYPS